MNKLENITTRLKKLQELFGYTFSVEIFFDESFIMHRESNTLQGAIDKIGDYENYEELIKEIDRLILEQKDDFWLDE